jgi:hypothetical protein
MPHFFRRTLCCSDPSSTPSIAGMMQEQQQQQHGNAKGTSQKGMSADLRQVPYFECPMAMRFLLSGLSSMSATW